MTTSTPEKQDGVKALSDAIVKIEETIKSLGGVFHVQMPVCNSFFFFYGNDQIDPPSWKAFSNIEWWKFFFFF